MITITTISSTSVKPGARAVCDAGLLHPARSPKSAGGRAAARSVTTGGIEFMRRCRVGTPEAYVRVCGREFDCRIGKPDLDLRLRVLQVFFAEVHEIVFVPFGVIIPSG